MPASIRSGDQHWEEIGFAATLTKPVGSGPFMLQEWVRGSHIIYERNPDYWDAPKPYIDRMVCKFLPDPGARSIAFENGSADIGYRTPVALSDLERLKKIPTLRFETLGTSYSYNVSLLQFNLDSQYFKHLKVRSETGRTAMFELNEGTLAGATLEDKVEDSTVVLREALRWKNGRFTFRSAEVAPITGSRQAIGGLLLEAMRLEDEARR